MSKINPSRSLSLTEAQRRVLVEAAGRADGALVLPRRIKIRAAETIAQALLGRKLVRETRAKAELPVWRQDGEGRRFSLVLTVAGRQLPDEGGASTPQVEPPKLSSPATAAMNVASGPRCGSKLDGVFSMLRRDCGTSMTELMAATGWLPHTTRAALTGLRKRGYAVSRQAAQDGSGSLYRIVEAAIAA